jgi:hypothetical protein
VVPAVIAAMTVVEIKSFFVMIVNPVVSEEVAMSELNGRLYPVVSVVVAATKVEEAEWRS